MPKKPKKVVRCFYCNKDYKSRHGAKMYCSPQCRSDQYAYNRKKGDDVVTKKDFKNWTAFIFVGECIEGELI